MIDRMFATNVFRGGAPFGELAPAAPAAPSPPVMLMGYGPGLLGDLVELALVGLILYLVFRALSRGRPGWVPRAPWAMGGTGGALDTARGRFARGDIGGEEFESIRRTLREEEARHEERSPAWAGRWGGDRALDIARERLARSEITPEQYDTIRKGLRD